ncbi:protein asteroid homolog 1-like [Mytilus trossulus]|uniref:protein asteroid homolog 1-like n=1 Tax=Mytilus trossulus TaxID=6551 RepID=UPI003004846B
MGIPSISNLVQKNPSFWTISDFQDIRLVIDANCLVEFLYKYQDIDTIGNYNEYTEKVEIFFKWLQTRRITPFVVFSGALGMDDKEIGIVLGKTKHRIGKPDEGMPILAKLTFINALDKLRINYVNSDFEADRDIQKLANDLKCPVLSANSDFFVFDVQFGYIPFDSLPFKSILNGVKKSFGEIKTYFYKNLLKKFPYLTHKMALLATALGNDIFPKNSKALQLAYLSANFRLPECMAITSDVLETPCERSSETFFITTRKILYWIKRCKDVERGKKQLQYFCKEDKKEEKKLFRSIEVYTETGNYTSYNLHDLIQRRNDKGFCRSPFPFGIRKWIIEHHRRGKIPNFIINTIIHQRNIFMCQLEGTHDTSSHDCSLSIREVIYAVLVGTETTITEYDRQEKSLCKVLRKGVISTTGILKDLHIPEMMSAVKIKILSSTLCCSVPSDKVSGQLEQTRLFLMITAYWTRVAEPSVNTNFIKSVLIGYVLFSARHKEFQPGTKIIGRLENLSAEVTKYADRRIKSYRDFVQNITYTFSQFQSCILYTTHLNRLLQCPLENVNPAIVYNGSFLHKMYFILNENDRYENDDIIEKHLYGCNVYVWLNQMLYFLQENVYIKSAEVAAKM